MTKIILRRFTQPQVLQSIGRPHLSRFFDRFKVDLKGENRSLPSPDVSNDGYFESLASSLSRTDTLPQSLIQALGVIEGLAAPENRAHLLKGVAETPACAALDPASSPECLALQIWLWARPIELVEEEPMVDGSPLSSSIEERARERSPSIAEPSTITQPVTAPPEPGGAASDRSSAPAETPSTQAKPPSSEAHTKCLGKVSRLPRDIREQLNRRLHNDEPYQPILDWLNALTEVQTIVAAQFGGNPVTRQNLYDWKQYGFRDWQMRQCALEFAQNLEADQAEMPASLAGGLTDKLAQWVALRYAAAAHAMAPTGDPEAELRRLRDFCGDIVVLRRGDLSAGRLSLEQARLAAEQADHEQEKEKEFWSWTKRPDIQTKLFPKRDQDQIRQQVVQMLDQELLGIRPPVDQTGNSLQDPAILI